MAVMDGTLLRGRPAQPVADVALLVSDAAAGDERAWRDLVDDFGGMVRAVARGHRLGDADAADVAQATWTRLFEHLGRLQNPERIGAWLATTARRECLRLLREHQRLVPRGDDLPDHADDAPWHGACLVDQERDATLWQAFESQCPRDRQVLRMLLADPAPSYEEIGAALDMPIGSIGPTRARALARLRRDVERLGMRADAVENWN
jgi:RNA polymerase sigma factor (sigma-70 family)